MVTYTVFNYGTSQLTNINIGGYDVPAMTAATGVTLTDAELAAAVALSDVVVVKDSLNRNQWRKLARALKYLKTTVGA